MKSTRKNIIIITILILALVIAVLVWSWVFRKADISVAGQKATIEIAAPDLLKAYEANEDSANLKYNDKVISVEGIVAEIKESQESISVYLKESNASSGVMCGFDKEVLQKKALKIGQKVKIKGICIGYLMDVVLNKCALEKKFP